MATLVDDLVPDELWAIVEQVRWDRDSGRFFAFVLVACALSCFNRL
jgi:hypothetical protein